MLTYEYVNHHLLHSPLAGRLLVVILLYLLLLPLDIKELEPPPFTWTNICTRLVHKMPRTRSAVNRRTSTTKKVETKPPPKVPKPSREQKAKVVKKPRSNKGKETSDDSTTSPICVGSKIPWTNDFGGKIYLHDGTKTSLKELVEKSHNGLIVYAYPKRRDDECMSYTYSKYLDCTVH